MCIRDSLSTLDYLIGSFDSDIITMDYRVRGFTRDVAGKKLFMDHKITSIQDYIDTETLQRYDAVDINVYQANPVSYTHLDVYKRQRQGDASKGRIKKGRRLLGAGCNRICAAVRGERWKSHAGASFSAC